MFFFSYYFNSKSWGSRQNMHFFLKLLSGKIYNISPTDLFSGFYSFLWLHFPVLNCFNSCHATFSGDEEQLQCWVAEKVVEVAWKDIIMLEKAKMIQLNLNPQWKTLACHENLSELLLVPSDLSIQVSVFG